MDEEKEKMKEWLKKLRTLPPEKKKKKISYQSEGEKLQVAVENLSEESLIYTKYRK